MRLDHLLSREKAKVETPELIPGRTVQGSEKGPEGPKGVGRNRGAEVDWRKSEKDRELNSHGEGQQR